MNVSNIGGGQPRPLRGVTGQKKGFLAVKSLSLQSSAKVRFRNITPIGPISEVTMGRLKTLSAFVNYLCCIIRAILRSLSLSRQFVLAPVITRYLV